MLLLLLLLWGTHLLQSKDLVYSIVALVWVLIIDNKQISKQSICIVHLTQCVVFCRGSVNIVDDILLVKYERKWNRRFKKSKLIQKMRLFLESVQFQENSWFSMFIHMTSYSSNIWISSDRIQVMFLYILEVGRSKETFFFQLRRHAFVFVFVFFLLFFTGFFKSIVSGVNTQ